MTNSLSGIAPMISDYRFNLAGYLAYMTAKHGLVGLMRAYALMLAPTSAADDCLGPAIGGWALRASHVEASTWLLLRRAFRDRPQRRD